MFMFYGLGVQELLVILAIAMLLFGGKKLPEVGRNLGKAIRGFKQAEDEATREIQEAARNAQAGETAETAGSTDSGETPEGEANEMAEDEQPDAEGEPVKKQA